MPQPPSPQRPAGSRVKLLEETRLRLAPSATAEIAGACLLAQQDAGLDSADFLVVALPPGLGIEAADAVRAAADRVAAEAPARPPDPPVPSTP